MIRAASTSLIVLASAALFACDSVSLMSLEPPELGPAETYNWGAQPVSFSPPPDGWRRERVNGERGVTFVKENGGGTAITVSERPGPGTHDRCEDLQALHARLERTRDRVDRGATIDRREQFRFLADLQGAQLFTEGALHGTGAPLYDEDQEAIAVEANEAIARAGDAYRSEDYDWALEEIAEAIELARQVSFTLDAVVPTEIERTRAEIAQRPQAELGDLAPLESGGVPGLGYDYRFFEAWRDTTFHGRHAYVMSNNHLFRAEFIGVEEHLPVFDAVLASVSFPPGECAR